MSTEPVDAADPVERMESAIQAALRDQEGASMTGAWVLAVEVTGGDGVTEAHTYISEAGSVWASHGLALMLADRCSPAGLRDRTGREDDDE